jgi:hypothetical protein
MFLDHNSKCSVVLQKCPKMKKCPKKILKCEKCDYSTYDISNFTKHINTIKHHENMNKPKIDDVNRLECIINKLIEQNNELTHCMKSTIESQNALICDMASQPKIITNNNSFNLTNYLEVKCKDAPNLSDFVDKLNINYDDLIKIKENGYIYGMEKSLLDELNSLETCKRPIQCTDLKRKQFFIKDKEEWEKDDECKRVNKLLSDITTKHIRALQQWKILNPDWLDNDNKLDIITDITSEILKGSGNNGERLKNKLIDKLSKVVKISK